MIHTVRLSQRPEQAWRNGGGSTRELLAWPHADDWALRLSVARIDRDGPFSDFPGVQRWFAVVGGAGVVLHGCGGPVQVRRGDRPVAFDGAEAPGCSLIDGPTLDLNLMLRRDAGRGHLAAVAADTPGPTTAWRGLYSHAAATLHAGDRTLALQAGTLAWSEAEGDAAWRVQAAGPLLQAWWIAFEPDTP